MTGKCPFCKSAPYPGRQRQWLCKTFEDDTGLLQSDMCLRRQCEQQRVKLGTIKAILFSDETVGRKGIATFCKESRRKLREIQEVVDND